LLCTSYFILSVGCCVKQQKEVIGSRNTYQEEEAERGAVAEKIEDCGFVEKGTGCLELLASNIVNVLGNY